MNNDSAFGLKWEKIGFNAIDERMSTLGSVDFLGRKLG